MKISEKTFNRLMNGVAIFAAIATLLVIFSVFHIGHVPSKSMVPTLNVDDILVIQVGAKAKRGDVILFYPHEEGNEQYVKRLIAVGGDTIAIHNGQVILNGEPLDEPYLNTEAVDMQWPEGAEPATEMEEYTIPEGYFWAMGDNRGNSVDSRFYGAFPNDRYIGKIVFHF